jgi:hypothetical protein
MTERNNTLQKILVTYGSNYQYNIEGSLAQAQAAIEALIAEARIDAGEWGVKYAIAEFCKMNIGNPTLPVNIDEVKRLAMESVKRREAL